MKTRLPGNTINYAVGTPGMKEANKRVNVPKGRLPSIKETVSSFPFIGRPKFSYPIEDVLSRNGLTSTS
jgi:hypothetical protein